MEMDVYDFDSYNMSLSNIWMLKLFHDCGVNVSGYSSPMVHVNYDSNNGFDILLEGLQEIFGEVNHYGYDEINSEDFIKRYGSRDKDDIPDSILIIHDPVFSKVFPGHRESMENYISELEAKTLHSHDVAVEILKDNSGIEFVFGFAGSNFHELVLLLLKLREYSIIEGGTGS
ncbi:hypothetical protein ACFVAD_18905 [Sutcliffiella sp. NPDC057660]|uniref:hypothetical protein n=1 Tax=Sutcliffiella sp. NPDC057660 TaxID=3346199 RepID=UPI003675141D